MYTKVISVHTHTYVLAHVYAHAHAHAHTHTHTQRGQKSIVELPNTLLQTTVPFTKEKEENEQTHFTLFDDLCVFGSLPEKNIVILISSASQLKRSSCLFVSSYEALLSSCIKMLNKSHILSSR